MSHIDTYSGFNNHFTIILENIVIYTKHIEYNASESQKFNISIQKSMGQNTIAKNEWNIISDVYCYYFAKFSPLLLPRLHLSYICIWLCVYSYRSIHNIPIYINILNGRSIFILVLFLVVSLHQHISRNHCRQGSEVVLWQRSELSSIYLNFKLFEGYSTLSEGIEHY